MDSKRSKNVAQWFYETVFREEPIRPAQQAPLQPLPALLQAARSLQGSYPQNWQSRESVFVKQGRLLADYEDDYPFSRSVLRYFPTYQSLTDEELRGYFTWRTKLRKGTVEQTSLSFAFVYIYELINLIGVTDAAQGYEKLLEFRRDYGTLDKRVLPYLKQWMLDFVVYYGLDSGLLEDHPKIRFDRQLWVLEDIQNQSDAAVAQAILQLSPKWLERSKFYRAYPQDTDRVLARSLRRISDHYDRRCKRGLTEQYFGEYILLPVRLFDSAVFCDTKKDANCAYPASPVRIYHCQNGLWSVQRYLCPEAPSQKLGEVVRTADAVMREMYGFGSPIQAPLDTKWIRKILREETQALLDEKQAAEAAKIHIDRSLLAGIRRDAAVTRDSLLVEEEMDEEPAAVPAPPQPQPSDAPLEGPEYRLLQCLLYGSSLSWVQQEGHLLSVLVDSINEHLYDTFADSVLTCDEPPQVLEDYLEELKEMVQP